MLVDSDVDDMVLILRSNTEAGTTSQSAGTPASEPENGGDGLNSTSLPRKPIAMNVMKKELRVRVRKDRMAANPYFHKLMQGPWRDAEGDPVLTFPSVRMLDGFWIAFCCFIAPDEYSVRSAPITLQTALQVHAAASMIGVDKLQERAEDYLIVHMSPRLFLRVFNACERFHRLTLKRKLFRWLCFSGALQEYVNKDTTMLSLTKDGRQILCFGKTIAPGQFYDVLREDLKLKRRFFTAGDSRVVEQPPPQQQQPNAKEEEEHDKDGTLIKCYIERIRNPKTSMHGEEETHFVLRSEETGQVLVAACHILGSSEFLFASQYPSRFHKDDLDFLGGCECNFVGTTFITYDHGLDPNTDPAANLFPEMIRGEHGAIIYDQNVLGRIPNAMTVILPDLRKRLPPGPSIVERYKRQQLEGILVLRTKKPSWNEHRRSWTLDFHGRVKIASKKNFKIQESANEHTGDWLMLFGKVTKHRFSLDYKPPLSIMQAFSIALSTFSDKLMVT